MLLSRFYPFLWVHWCAELNKNRQCRGYMQPSAPPHGFTIGFSTTVTPAFIAEAIVSSTLSVVKPISIPKGLLARLVYTKPAFRFDSASRMEAKESIVPPVKSSA